MDGSTELKSEQHDFDGTSDGVNVTTNAYHISDYQPTKENYQFDGWYETSDFSGNKITTSTDLTGNKTLYAKWESNIIHCNVGYYLPAGSRECAECENGYYCPDSRDYDYNETTPQGNVKCPDITNVKEGFYFYGPDDVPVTERNYAGDINLRDNVGDCLVVGLYTNFPAEMTTLMNVSQKENYNPNLDVNQTVFEGVYNCAYNSSTNKYDRCLVLEKVCKNGYYVPESEANNYINKTVENVELNAPTPCVPAERGYYTNAYDTIEYKVANNVEIEENTIIPYRDKIGVLFGVVNDKYTYVSPIDFTESTLSDWYKQCPDAYPDSDIASWQVAQCYATVTFM
ncbi:MAG: InlB B-repeat-containing protein, partial [Alphaproteobacteria bacterium]|nr:InlB B-repeat-containing protein [Alphaproteobacteria bacterium]